MLYLAWNKAPVETKRRYFELVRQGVSGVAASQRVGVSPSCESLWFIDAGSVSFVDKPINGRYLTQEDRIEIADGLAVALSSLGWTEHMCSVQGTAGTMVNFLGFGSL